VFGQGSSDDQTRSHALLPSPIDGARPVSRDARPARCRPSPIVGGAGSCKAGSAVIARQLGRRCGPGAPLARKPQPARRPHTPSHLRKMRQDRRRLSSRPTAWAPGSVERSREVLPMAPSSAEAVSTPVSLTQSRNREGAASGAYRTCQNPPETSVAQGRRSTSFAIRRQTHAKPL
jgi:hypothetical protein